MEFRLLGPVEVVEDGRALSLGGRRQRAVLTHLLVHRGTPVPADWLIDRVWADAAPPAVRTSLHTYLSRLRTTLGPPRLETRSQGYVLHAEPDEVDADRFSQCLALARSLADDSPDAAATAYDDALTVVRGPALGDLADEPSLQAEATRLDGLVAAARRERIGVRLRLGQHALLVPELEDLLRRDPLQEDLWADYVLALYRADRQRDALAAYERARAALRDELGIAPSPRLRRLHEQVLRQDPELTPATSALRGYRLLGVLGEGASAVVHRAVQPHTGRDVALKALHPWLADDPDLVARFAAEAQAALQVEHPGVVPLYDYWREPGGAFLVLRLLRGGDLRARLERGPVELSAVLRLAEQVSAALGALGGRGIAAQPVGLDDVLLDEHDNAYLSGFCLARRSGAGLTGGDPGSSADEAVSVGCLLRDVLRAVPAAPRPVLDLVDRAVAGGFADSGELCAALRTALPVTSAPVRRLPARNPYKGLRAFGEADADDFFGRGELVARLVARLAERTGCGPRRFLAVVGPSGSGKSSLVRAGLVPALRGGAVPEVPAWYVADLVPGTDPFGELVRALQEVAVRPLRDDAAARLRFREGALAAEVADVLPDAGELLLVVDQFEELFTLVSDADREAFGACLVAAVTAHDSRVRVVVTLRADFYDRPLGDRALSRLLQDGTEVVVPLTPDELERAVVEPAARVGLDVEPALLATVVADVGSTATALPLLQYALTELVERRGSGGLTLAGYRELGGVSGALVRRADAVHRGLTADQQAVARRVLLQLVHPDESGADTRRRVLQQELELRTGAPHLAREVLAALGDARLLAFDRDPATRAPTVEVAHEALLREWGLLRGWLDAARDDLRAQRRLTAVAREWDDAGRDASFLATGFRLEALERSSSRGAVHGGGVPTALERAYLDASLHARDQAQEAEQRRGVRELALERRSVRRLRVAAGVLVVAVVGMSSLAAFGFAQQDRAERESLLARSRALAAGSSASLTDDPERAVLLALEAVGLTRDAGRPVLPEAEEALHSAVAASRVLRTMRDIGGTVDWSARGQLVTEGPEESGLVELRDAETGEVARRFPGHVTDVNDVAFSPDGTRLATTGDDGAVRLWDPATGRLVWERAGTGEVWRPTFSGDGQRVAASWLDEGVVRVLAVATGEVVAELASLPDPFATALTHDGSRIVVSGGSLPGAAVLDVRTGRQVLHLLPDGTSALGVDLSPDGRWLVTGGADARARIWSMRDGSLSTTVRTTGAIHDVDWSRDSARLVIGGQDGIVRVVEVTEEAAREVVRLSSTVLRGVFGVAFSPDAQRVLLGDLDVRAAQVFDVSVAGSREWATAPVPYDYVGADFSRDGTHVLASSPDGGLAVRAVETGDVVRTVGAARGAVHETRTSPDGSLVAAGVDDALVVWDVSSGQERFAVPLDGGPQSLAWSDGGGLLAFTDWDHRVHLVERTGRAVPAPRYDEDDGVTDAALSSDGRLLVTVHRDLVREASGTGWVEVLDRTAGRVVHRWDLDADRVDVSPDGRVAVGTPAGEVVLLHLTPGEPSVVLSGHVGQVWDMDFSSDGSLLATSGEDKTARVWDVRAGAQAYALRGHGSIVMTGRFSADGARLVTASADETLRVWAVDLDDLVQLARARTTRSLTDDECRRYLQQACR